MKKITLLLLLVIASFTSKAQTRYWFGGSGNWNDQNHWSLTSGGTATVTPPNVTDDVVFDLNSGFTAGNKTITMPAGTSRCRSVAFTCTVAPTITGPGRLDTYGNVTLQAGMTMNTWGGEWHFYQNNISAILPSPHTITTANNTFANSNIVFEPENCDYIINDLYTQAAGTMSVNLSNKTNSVTFNQVAKHWILTINKGTVNDMAGFTTGSFNINNINSVFKSYGNGNGTNFATDGEVYLNAGNTLAGNTYTFSAVGEINYNQPIIFDITNCTVNISGFFGVGRAMPTATINALGSTMHFLPSADFFYPYNYTWHDVIVDEATTPATATSFRFFINWGITTNYTLHSNKPVFDNVSINRNCFFQVNDNTVLPGSFPLINNSLTFTAGHKYSCQTAQTESPSTYITFATGIGRNFAFDLSTTATLNMLGTCTKPITLNGVAFGFKAGTTINSDWLITNHILATGPAAPYNAGANSYFIPGTNTTGWTIPTPAHRILVWVGAVPSNTNTVAQYGNWNDNNNWRDVTSNPTWASVPIGPGYVGGSPICPLPTMRDSVIFPDNSFVNCDANISYCEGMNWLNKGRIFSTATKDLEVWGSLYLSAAMKNDFAGTFMFRSEKRGTANWRNWITTNNQAFDFGVLFNSNDGLGEWELKDSLKTSNTTGLFDPDCGYYLIELRSGHLHTGNTWCTPGNGQTIYTNALFLHRGAISLYDSDVHITGLQGWHTGLTVMYKPGIWSDPTNEIKVNAGTSNFILHNEEGPNITGAGANRVSGNFGWGHRWHDITLNMPAIGSYTSAAFTGVTHDIYLRQDTVNEIIAANNTRPFICGLGGSDLGLVKKIWLKSTNKLSTISQGFGSNSNTYFITVDDLIAEGSVDFGLNVRVRNLLKFSSGYTYNLGTTPTGATAMNINLLGPSTTTNNPFVPYQCALGAFSYTAGAFADISGTCSSPVTINNGSFSVTTTAMNTYTTSYLTVNNNTVGGTNAPLKYSNSVLSGTTTGWSGISGAPRALRWKDASAIVSNNGNWNNSAYWEEVIKTGVNTYTVKASGAAPQCPPTALDTVIYDNTSFSANNQIATINLGTSTAECASMYWNNITAGSAPQFSSTPTQQLNIYDNLKFDANMVQNFGGPILFRGAPAGTFTTSTITSATKQFNNRITFDADGANKVWNLADNITAPYNAFNTTVNVTNTFTAAVNLFEGKLIGDNLTWNIGSFYAQDLLPRSLSIKNATVNLSSYFNEYPNVSGSWDVVNSNASFSLSAGGSVINNLVNPNQNYFCGGGKKYNNVNFTSNGEVGFGRGFADRDTFNVVTFNPATTASVSAIAYIGRTGAYLPGEPIQCYFHKLISNVPLVINSNDCTFDSLVMNKTATINANEKYNKYLKFSDNTTYYLKPNTVQWAKNKCEVDLIGSPSANIQLYSTITNQQAYIRKDSTYLCADYINMRDIWAIGGGSNTASCNSYTNTGVNTNCAPLATFSTHCVSSCDTITDLGSSCGPWDQANLTRGRADFNAGSNADLQANDFGWAKRGYPPVPNLNLALASPSICLGDSVRLAFTGTGYVPFTLTYYSTTGDTISQTIKSAADLNGYNASTGSFTYTPYESPTISTSYYLGYLIVDRCFNSKSATGTGTVNVTVNMPPTAVIAASSPTTICAGVPFNINANATASNSYTLFPTPTGTASPTPMTSYTVGAAVNGSVTIAAGTFTAGSSSETYTVYAAATTSLGCASLTRTPVQITINPTPSVSITSTNVACFGNATGAVSYTATGGSGGGYSISPSITGLTQGVYNYTVTDANGCKTNTTATITQPASALSAIPTGTNNTNCITADGQVSVNASGGTSGYNYLWSTGASTLQTVSGLTGGTYTVTVTDNNNCTYTTQATIVNPSAPVITASSNTNTICSGNNITITPSGGATTYSIIPSIGTATTGITGATIITPTATTSYSVVGTNSTSCLSNTVNFNVTVNATPVVTIAATSNTICNGQSTTLNLTGATSYTLLNTNTPITSGTSFSPSANETYTVIGSNAGCTSANTQQLITVNALPSVTATASSASVCAGSTATLTASGANTYSWTSGPSTATYTVNTANTFTVTGTNTVTGCRNTANVIVAINPLPVVTANASAASICSGNTATLTAGGAQTYTWTSPASTNTVITVTPTTNTVYTVTGTDANNCVNSRTVSVAVNATPTVAITAANNTICIGNSSALTLAGASTYTLLNTGLPITSGASVSPTTTTTYSIQGSTGTCTSSATQQLITVNPLPVVTATTSATAICSGNTATLTAAGANTYTWSGGPMAATYTVNTTNSYVVTGTDANNCTNTATVNLTVNPTPTVNISTPTSTICAGQIATLTAATANSYIWSTSSTANTTTVMPTGTTVYTVTGTNTAGSCTATAQFTVSVNPKPDMALTNTTSIVCLGDANGTATVNTTSGTSGYNYTWTGSASTSSVATNLAGPTHTAIVTDARGCKDTLVVNIAAPSLSLSTSVATATTGCSLSNGTATLTPSGGWNTSYAYIWQSNGSTTYTATGYAAGTYTAQVTDANGCVKIQNFTISNPSTPSINAVASNPTICSGVSTTITPSGAISYSITGGAVSSSTVGTSFTVNPTANTTYSIIGIDASNCISTTATVAINVNATPTVAISATNNTICIGNSSALTLTGATTYTLLNTLVPITSGASVSPTTTTTYSIQGSTGTCTSSATQQVITVNALPVVTATTSSAAICSGNTATLTAGGATSYVWTSGPSTPNYVVTTAGIYTVTGTDANACVNTQTVSLSVNALPVVTATASSTAICSGNTATLTAGGANSYVWTSGPSTPNYAVTAAGVYTVTGTDANTCSNTQTISLSVNALPVVTATASSVAICAGNTATLTAGGANSYAWTSGPSTPSYVVSTAGVYTVTGIDGNNCSNTKTVSVTVNALPTVTATANNATICANQTATLTAAGANTYTWTSGPTSATYIVNTTNDYVVTGTDANNCTNTATVSLLVNPLPTVTAVSNATAICVNQTATLTAGGAQTYTWTSPASTNTVVTVNPITTTTYVVTGTDGNNCVNTQTVTLTVNQLPIIATTTVINVSCFGANNGSVIFTTTAGTPTYVIAGTNVSGTTASGLAPTDYTYTVTDAAGCVNTTTLSITQPTAALAANAAVTATNSSCTSPNGAFAITATGGTMNYTYTIDGGSPTTNSVTTNLSSGPHTYEVTDANGCVTTTGTVTISGTPGITSSVSNKLDVLCFGNNTASVTVTGAGGSTYDYTLTPITATTSAQNNTNGTFTGLSSGTYSVLVKDQISNCISTNTITISTPTAALALTGVTANSVVCNGGTAQVTTTVTGGTTPYAYVWSANTSTLSTATYTAGNYSVNINDANGCLLATQNFTINEAPVLNITSVATTTTGCGLSNGTATINANGGWNGSYTYSINGVSQSTNTATGLPAATYTADVMDALGCTTQTIFVIANPTTPTLSIASNNMAICVGNNATITPTGASSYTMGAVNFTTSTSVNPGSTTVYNITGTDAANCTSAPLSVTVTVNELPTLSLASSNAAICAGQTATLTASTTGTTTVDTYTWSTGSTTVNTTTVSPTAQTVYTVVGTNTVTGCVSAVQSVTVDINQNPTLAVASQTNVTCLGSTDGIVTFTTDASSYTITPATTGLGSGAYTFTVTDLATTCTNTVSATIAAPSASLAIASVATTTTGCGLANGTATITANGGWNTSYTYSLNAVSQSTNTLTGLPAATYTADVTDALGCTTQTVFTITNPNSPTLSIAANPAAICAGQSVTLTPNGAISYTLNGTTTFTTDITLNPSSTTVYNITGTDASSCTSTPLTVTVNVNALPTISVASTSSAICAGNNATLTATQTGTTTIDTYSWSTGVSTTNTETVSPTTQTVYTVAGTNTLTGCVSSVQSITVNVNATPTVAVASQTNVLCFGSTNGTIVLSSSSTNTTVVEPTTNLAVGDYTFTIVDNTTTCTNTLTATITGPTVALTAVVNNTTTNTSCATPNGAFTVTANGGTPSYTYNATNTTGIFVNQGTGTQNITVADANGCTYTVSATIPGIATPSVSATTQTNVLCNGQATGAAAVTVTGGTPTYTYTWSNNAGLNSNTQPNLSVGAYTVTATDAGSCTATQVFVITQPNAMNVITTNTTAPCVGQSNGNASIEISGGTPNYNVAWNPTSTIENTNNTSTISNIGEGSYIATVTDANSCSYQHLITIKAEDGIGCTLQIPEIYSPNGDGKNDTWEIKGLENYPNNNVTVFNRWGDQVFKAEPYKNDWDGTNAGDKSILGKGTLPVGTYYFILDLGNGDKPITGYVQLTK